MKNVIDAVLEKLDDKSFVVDTCVVTLAIAQDAIEDACEKMKNKAIEAFKENCQHPKDTKGCECKLCIRYVGGHCELLDGFIEKLNS